MFRKVIFLLFMLVASYSKELELNLDDAISLALKNNSLNKISKLNLQIAQAQYEQALSANYPSLNVMLYANRDNKDTVFQQRGEFKLSPEYTKILALANTLSISSDAAREVAQATISAAPVASFPSGTISADIDSIARGRDTISAQLQLKYPLYTAGKIDALIEQAKLNKSIKQQAIIRDRNSVVFDVKKYFYGYILTNELYETINEVYSNMKFSRDLTKDFLENSTSLQIKKTDYLNIKLLTTLIESTLYKIDLNRKMIESAILNTLGLKYNQSVKIKYEKQKILKQNIALQNLVKKAKKLNPDIRSINFALKIKEEMIKEIDAEHYPSVGLYGNISHTYNSYKYGYLNDDDANRWSIGLAVKIPIFNGFRTKNTLIEKRLDKKVVSEQKILLEEALSLQLKNEFLKSSMGYKQIEILKDAVTIAEENSKMNLKGYKYEMVEARDLVQSQLMEVYVKSDYLKSIYDYLLSLATIDRLVGEKIDEKLN